MMIKSVAVVMILAAGVSLGACAPQVATTDEPVATGTPRPLPTPEPISEGGTGTPEATPTPTPTDDGVAAFGEGFTYSDGLKVSVSKPVKVAKPDYATWADLGVDKDDVYLVKFTVTMTNTGTTVVDPSMASLTVVAGEAGNELEVHCWGDVVTCGTSQSSLRTGRKVTMSWGFILPRKDAGLITAEVSPTFDHERAVFEGAFK